MQNQHENEQRMLYSALDCFKCSLNDLSDT